MQNSFDLNANEFKQAQRMQELQSDRIYQQVYGEGTFYYYD